MYEFTKNWLIRNKIIYDELYVGCKNKLDICVTNNIDIFIDDNFNTCKDIAANSNIKVFMYSTRYNQQIKTDIQRVVNWQQLLLYVNMYQEDKLMKKQLRYIDVEKREDFPPESKGMRFIHFYGGTKNYRGYLVPQSLSRADFMAKKMVLIGGGENGRILENGKTTLYETELIDKEIIRLTKKKAPNYLFMDHAMHFSTEIQDSYYKTMKKIYGKKFGCNCKHLRSDDLQNKEYVQQLIDWADIIYEGGGDTLSMIELWKKTGFDIILFDAWNKGKVICGISAGAVCWFKYCNSEACENKFELLKCLGWLDAFVTPHCDEKGRIESSKEQLKNLDCVGILMSNCSAIEIIDDKYRIISEKCSKREFSKGYIYKTYMNNGKYITIKLKDSKDFLPLALLLKNDTGC